MKRGGEFNNPFMGSTYEPVIYGRDPNGAGDSLHNYNQTLTESSSRRNAVRLNHPPQSPPACAEASEGRLDLFGTFCSLSGL